MINGESCTEHAWKLKTGQDGISAVMFAFIIIIFPKKKWQKLIGYLNLSKMGFYAPRSCTSAATKLHSRI